MSTFHAKASVSTRSGNRYIQQLCKHWSHKLPVELSPGRGAVVFPKDLAGSNSRRDAVVNFMATDNALEVSIAASAAAQLELLEDVVTQHLDRFAFREAPLRFDWERHEDVDPNR